MKHFPCAGPLRKETPHPARSRRHIDWEWPVAAEDPYWREWNQKKQRKEMY